MQRTDDFTERWRENDEELTEVDRRRGQKASRSTSRQPKLNRK